MFSGDEVGVGVAVSACPVGVSVPSVVPVGVAVVELLERDMEASTAPVDEYEY